MVNYLTTPDNVRKRLGLTPDEAPDEVVYEYISTAQKDVRKDLAFFQFDDTLSGNINGVNTTFSTCNSFIADMNYDNIVNNSDIEVYGWTISDDPGTRVTISLSTIYPEYGKVVTNSAPSGLAKITARYYYYDTYVDSELIPEACADLAAYLYAGRELLLMPRQWMFGAYRFIKSVEYKELLESYYGNLDKILGYASLKDSHDEPTLIRG